MKTIKFLAVVLIATLLISCNNNSQGVTNKPLKTEIDSVSYAIGLDLAFKLRSSFDEVNKDALIQGYQNGLDSTKLLLTKEELGPIMMSYFTKKKQLEAKAKADEALKKLELEFGDIKVEGEKFIADNKTKDGVITTESGLQYIVLKEGVGAQPKRTERVKVHYHGTLIDGTVFDSSVDKGKPYETGVGQVVKGWVEALQIMKVGSKYKLFIPQELAYGANPRKGGVIKPFMPLIFEIELLEIK